MSLRRLWFLQTATHARRLGALAAEVEGGPILWTGPDPSLADHLPDGSEYVPLAADEPLFGVSAVVFSTLQPIAPIVRLLGDAAREGIPTVSVQEVHQIALTGGRVQNSLLPVDHLLAASPFEAMRLEESGLPGVRCFGWPFRPGARTVEPRRARSWPPRRIGVFLPAAPAQGDDPRQALLDTVLAAVEGRDVVLVLRTHPLDERPLEGLEGHTIENSPAEESITDAFRRVDVAVTRGDTQVAFDAILHGIPTLVAAAPDATPFEGSAVHCADAAALGRALDASSPPRLPEPFLTLHGLDTADEARTRTVAFLRDIDRLAASKSAGASAESRRTAIDTVAALLVRRGDLLPGRLADPDRWLRRDEGALACLCDASIPFAHPFARALFAENRASGEIRRSPADADILRAAAEDHPPTRPWLASTRVVATRTLGRIGCHEEAREALAGIVRDFGDSDPLRLLDIELRLRMEPLSPARWGEAIRAVGSTSGRTLARWVGAGR